MLFLRDSKILVITCPSSGVISPSPTACTTDVWAKETPSEVFTSGRSIEIGRDFLGGQIRSRHSFKAVRSPSFASSMAFLVNSSPSPSRSFSTARVVLWRVPGFFPAGLPDSPFFQRYSLACFRSAFSECLDLFLMLCP